MEKQERKVEKRPVTNQKKKKRKVLTKVLKVILIILLLLAILIGGFVVYSGYKNGWGLSGMLATVVGHDEETLKNLDEMQVLLLGISTDTEAILTDTIMVASYNPKNQSASLLSIPRDTFVGKNENTAGGFDKINAVYQLGIEKIITSVNNLTGLDIKYYVVVDTEALIKLVDEIGGVEFNVPIDMDYDDSSQDLHIHLKAGLQKLNGEQAENVVRFRHNNDGSSYPAEYGDNDTGRMRTQREFINQLIKQTVQVKNIVKIGGILDIAYEYIDTNIALSVLKDYIPYAVDFSTENLKTGTIPGTNQKLNGLWFFKANKTKTQEMINEMFESKEPEENNDETAVDTKENSKIKIEVLNGTGITSNLSSTVTTLKEKGYTVSKKGEVTKTKTTTIIINSDVEEAVAQNIKETLGVGIISKTSNTVSKADITIVIGENFNK